MTLLFRALVTLTLICASVHLMASPDLIVHNARVTTPESDMPTAFSVKGGLFAQLTSDEEALLSERGPDTIVIDAEGRRVIPGINDSHTHIVRGGRFYNLETRWEGLDSLAEGIEMIRDQAKRTPEGQWVRVVGGWSPYQFKEKRMPTPEELTEAAPNTPVFVLHLYSSGVLNKAGLKALGIDRNTVAPTGSEFVRDENGEPTGMLVANPNPMILYRTIATLPPMSLEDQRNSTEQFYRKLLSLGMTSAIDAGGGGHQFPHDYVASSSLAATGELPMRVSNYLFPQQPGKELEQFMQWMHQYKPNQNLHLGHQHGYVVEGGGELLVWSGSDYENFRAERPELKSTFAEEFEEVVRLHLLMKWPFRVHATYNESISQMLVVLEKIHRDQPVDEVRWAFDHVETITDENLKRVKALGGGIAVQGRMAFAGEDFHARYGAELTSRSPPIRRIIDMGIPLAMGTDGTRVSSFNPWPTYYWMVSGRTVGGFKLYGKDNIVDRETALRLFTKGSAWMSGEENVKGEIAVGEFADFAILNQDIFKVDERDLLKTESELTVVDGKIRFATDAFPAHTTSKKLASPAWSPVNFED